MAKTAKMMGAAFAAMLSMAGVKKAEAHPHHDHGHNTTTTTQAETRYQAWAREAQATRSDVDVLFVDFTTYVAVNPQAESALAADYYQMDRAKIANDIRKMFPQGEITMRFTPEGEKRPVNMDIPTDMIVDEMSRAYVELAGNYVDSAVARGYDFKTADGRDARVCLASNATQMTGDELAKAFTNMQVNAGDMPIEYIYDTIAHHELAHCMTPEVLDAGRTAGEGIADVYALARHVQNHGLDDNFTYWWRDMRAVSAMNRGPSTDYNLTPILDTALPKIREAYQNGELQNLSPAEVLAKSKAWSFGDNERQQVRRATQFQREGARFNTVLAEIHNGGLFGLDGSYKRFDDVNTLSPQALAALGGYEKARQTIQTHSIDLTEEGRMTRYQEQLTELIETRPTSLSKIQTLQQRQAEVNEQVERVGKLYGNDMEAYQEAMQEAREGEMSLLDQHTVLQNVERELAAQVEPAMMQHVAAMPQPDMQMAAAREANVEIER